MHKIMVVGNYGIDNRLNGQSARTRTITSTLMEMKGKYRIVIIDTKKKNIKIFLQFVFNAFLAKKIVIMPAQKSLKPIIMFLSLINALNKTSYIVIGGWLDEAIEKNPQIVKKFKKMNCLLVQTESLKSFLVEKGIRAKVLCNYRIYRNGFQMRQKTKDFVFYSRIRKDKGIELAINAVLQINNTRNKQICLDIYGPIDDDYKNEFESLVRKSNMINYCGIINGNEKIIETLSGYNVLLFPTFYEGEGYPGAILESITSGVPIIASDWKYNKEIIEGDNSGVIIKPKSEEDLMEKMLLLLDNRKLLLKLSENCLKASKKYSEKTAALVLKEAIGI